MTHTHLSWTPSTQPQHLHLQLHVFLCCPSTFYVGLSTSLHLSDEAPKGVKPLPGPLPLRILPEKPRGPLSIALPQRKRGRVRRQAGSVMGNYINTLLAQTRSSPGNNARHVSMGNTLGSAYLMKVSHPLCSPLTPATLLGATADLGSRA